MAHTFVAFIDERGEEGGMPTGGSSEWFILSAVVVRESNLSLVETAVSDFRAVHKVPHGKKLKFSDLPPKRRVLYCRYVAHCPVRVATVIFHKPSKPIVDPEADPIRLFRYSMKLLLERISWICRDGYVSGVDGDGRVKLVFSERKKFDYEKVKEYVRLLRSNPKAYNTRMEWAHIDPDLVEAIRHEKSPGCHFADAVASATGQALEPHDMKLACPHKGIYDDRALRELKSVTYHPSGCGIDGNGIKIWPPAAMTLVATEPRFTWLRLNYRE